MSAETWVGLAGAGFNSDNIGVNGFSFAVVCTGWLVWCKIWRMSPMMVMPISLRYCLLRCGYKDLMMQFSTKAAA